MKKTSLAIAFLIGFCLISLMYYLRVNPAPQKNVRSGLRGNPSCENDFEKFCKDAAPGPDLPQCLRAHESELSADCRQVVANMRPRQGGRGGIGKACKEDLISFCKDVAPGPERPKCLKEHEKHLSIECREAVANMNPRQGGRGSAIGKACKNDLDSFCKDVEPGPERLQCLKDHQSKLSAECGNAVSNARPRRGGAPIKACMSDLEKLCKDIEPGLGKLMCLKVHHASLTPECREAVRKIRPPQ